MAKACCVIENSLRFLRTLRFKCMHYFLTAVVHLWSSGIERSCGSEEACHVWVHRGDRQVVWASTAEAEDEPPSQGQRGGTWDITPEDRYTQTGSGQIRTMVFSFLPLMAWNAFSSRFEFRNWNLSPQFHILSYWAFSLNPCPRPVFTLNECTTGMPARDKDTVSDIWVQG